MERSDKSSERRIAELEQANAKLADLNAHLIGALENISDGFVLFDADDRLVLCNSKFREIYKSFAHLAVPGTKFEDLIREQIKHIDLSAARGREEEWVTERLESHRNPKESRELYFETGRWVRYTEHKTSAGGIVGIQTDITEFKERSAELETSEARFRALIDSTPSAILIKDPQGRYLLANKLWHEWFNPDGLDITGKTVFDFFPDDHAAEIYEADAEVVETGILVRNETTTPLADGRVLSTLIQKFPIVGPDGQIVGVGGINTDISDQKETEENLEASERQLRTITDSLPVMIAYIDSEQRYKFVNKTLAQSHAAATEEIVGQTVASILGKDSYAKIQPFINKVLTGESVVSEDTITYPGGITRNIEFSFVPDMADGGNVQGYFALVVDLTERRKAEEALRKTEDRLIDVIESISEGFILYDQDERFVLCNDKYKDFYSTMREILLPGAKLEDIARIGFERGVVKGASENVEYFLNQRLIQYRTAQGTLEQELPDGRWLLCTERKTADGYTVGIRTDITEIKLAGEQLRQAQKMEAVGQLTGGVAHDFNNLLGVIIGNLDALADGITENDAFRSYVDAATAAALNGAELNRQLLAFSRQQALSPKVINLNDSVSSMLGILRRTLGETIEIEAKQSAALWSCEVDPAQVESAVLNLAVNARDAIPEGGKLTIETANVHLDEEYAATQSEVVPGEYVVLSMTDTGCGMDQRTLEHAFEPFFTTKDVGKGSGLGLSMVFGFAKQSGGHVTLYSELGQGTTVKLYLPRVRRDIDAPAKVPTNLPSAEGETVLVVEDDPDLQKLVVAMISGLGYEVIAANDGKSALEAVAKARHIDLLLTDVILPGGMNGPEIARAVSEKNPGLKVLMMSGYPRDAITQQGQLGDGVALLEKPFRKTVIAQKIRDVLTAGP